MAEPSEPVNTVSPYSPPLPTSLSSTLDACVRVLTSLSSPIESNRNPLPTASFTAKFSPNSTNTSPYLSPSLPYRYPVILDLDAQEESHDPHFEPVVRLTEQVEAKTGEEDDEVLFKM
jgi:hypothetical protein